MELTQKQQEKAAKEFAKKWENIGDEKQDTQRFWMELLQNVYGIENPADFIAFEQRVQLGHTSYIDAMIPATHTMIEQKSLAKDFNSAIRQSDGSVLTPAEQAKRYAAALPYSERPRWIVSCNFKEFHVLDMERPNDSAEIIELKKLGSDFYRLNFLVDVKSSHIEREMEISKGAGELVARLYDSLLAQYKINALLTEEEILHNINKLCVRLVFCLYAEDSGLFGKKNLFHDYLQDFQPHQVRNALMDLFRILDTEESNRSPYETEKLLEFPYVNGSLFGESVEIPQFSEDTVNLILEDACNFDWSEISPTIFGAIFESTLNPDTRRHGGMHYTSIENIHKLIDPLFLDEFRNEFKEAMSRKDGKKKIQQLKELQDKMASKTFFDPAAGSGNFLTESYLSLRRLENDILRETITDSSGTGVLGFEEEEFNPIKVSIQQFYGIEINDFAVSVAKTAIWIAEAQMFKETEVIIHKEMDFLPLKSYSNIFEGNAAEIDWESIVRKENVSYIFGNPPFVGTNYMQDAQRQDMDKVFAGTKKRSKLDYVSIWYKLASQFILDTNIKCAFVSTNSITQGEQVPLLWEDILHSCEIIFAYKTFVWSSETKNQAKVHCVIIGFACKGRYKDQKYLYNDNLQIACKNINAYLIDAPNVFISSRTKTLNISLKMMKGSQPTDGGNLLLDEKEKNALVTSYPILEDYIRPCIGAAEFINNRMRYCLWLKDVEPKLYRNIRPVVERLEKVRELRLSSSSKFTREKAVVPYLFTNIRQPQSNYLVVPSVSSERRRYVPIGYLDAKTIATNLVLIVPNAEKYHFAILTSNVHMAWMRAFCGRLKSDYRYSAEIVFNTFPWPELTVQVKSVLEKTGEKILQIREQYPESSLADLYDELLMPIDLRSAHRENNKAVMSAYGFSTKMTEEECVVELMKLYEEKLREGNLTHDK